MKPTSEILERIEKCSSEHKDGVFTRLYRYLLREDIYYAAYQKLYANKGATTQGKPRSAYQTQEYHAASKELKRLSYWIDHTADEAARQELIDQHRAQKKAMRNLPCKPADNKKFTFVRYADDWLAGVCGTKAECEDLKAEIAEFLSTELKLTLSEEKTLI